MTDPNPYSPPGTEVADVAAPPAAPTPTPQMHWVVKLLAVLLGGGGVLGMGISVWLALKSTGLHWVYLIPAAGLFFLFFWSALSGLRLWRNEPRGWKWAKRLFAAQIPVITVPGLTYQYYTGLYLTLAVGQTDRNLGFAVGTNANIFIDTSIKHWVFGVNLFAVFALVFLMRASRRKAAEPSATLP